MDVQLTKFELQNKALMKLSDGLDPISVDRMLKVHLSTSRELIQHQSGWLDTLFRITFSRRAKIESYSHLNTK